MANPNNPTGTYLDKNEIRYEMFNNNITTTIKFNLDDIKLLTIRQNKNKEQYWEFAN